MLRGLILRRGRRRRARTGGALQALLAAWLVSACAAGDSQAALWAARATGQAEPVGDQNAGVDLPDANASSPPPNDPNGPASEITVVGRTLSLDPCDPFQLQFGRPGVSFGVCFQGTDLTARMQRLKAVDTTRFNVVVDGGPSTTMTLDGTQASLALARGLSPGAHEIWWSHRNETQFVGSVQLSGLDVGAGGTLLAAPTVPSRAIEVVGASVDVAFGVESSTVNNCNSVVTQNPDLSWFKLTADAVGARAINSGVSGMGMAIDITGSTASVARKVWPLADPSVPAEAGAPSTEVDAVFIDLTENDYTGFGGAGLADANNQSAWQEAALAFLAMLFSAYPETRVYFVINAGQPEAHRVVLRSLLPDTINKATAAGLPATLAFLEFPLDPQATMACAGHPTPAAHARMAAQATAQLRRDLGW